MRRRRDDEFMEEEAEFRRALDAVPPPTPPDGGWGWVVVLSSFFMNMVVDGVCYSYGILLPDLVSHYGTSTAMISLGGALLLGSYMMSGPVASALCNRFGSRRIAMIGCLISSLALLFSPLSKKDSVFIVLFGLCGGIGFGMMFLASLVVVGFYFEKNRGIAATIAMCGSSVGMAVISPLTRFLLDKYGWQGAIVILSGISLNGFVFSSLLRPIDADLRRRKKMILKRMEEDKRIGVQTCVILQRLIEQKRQDRAISSGSLNNAIITRDNQFIKEKDLHKHKLFSGLKSAFSRSSVNLVGHNSSRNCTPLMSRRQPAPPAIVLNDGSPGPSVENSPNLHRSTSPIDLRKKVLLSQSGQLRSNTSNKSLNLMANQSADSGTATAFSSVQDLPVSDDLDQSASTQYLVKKFLHATPDVDRPMYRKDIYYMGSVQQLPQYHNDIDEYVASITEIPREESQSDQDCWSRLTWLPKSISDVLKSVFDVYTFTSPTYILLVISTSLTMLGYYVPFLLMPSYVLTIPEDISGMSAALLLSILGASNTFGRILCGILGSKKWVDALLVNNLALLIAGGATMAIPFCGSYAVLSMFAVGFGICVSAFSTLRSVIVVELMGLDKLTTCFSQLVIFHGIAIIAGAPIASYLYVQDQHYAFYFSGAAMFISGFISLPLRRISQWERKKRGEMANSTSSDEEMKHQAFIRPVELVGI